MERCSTVIGRGAVVMLALAAPAAFGQVDPWTSDLWSAKPTAQSSLGLQPGKARAAIGCGASLLPCANEQAAFAATQAPSSLRWNLELSTLNLGTNSRAPAFQSARQGLNLSLVGRKPLFGSSFSVYGRVGTSYAMPDSVGQLSVPGSAGDSGHGLSFGAGVSMDLTPRLSATFGFDSYDLKPAGSARDLRSTSLGLQYRY